MVKTHTIISPFLCVYGSLFLAQEKNGNGAVKQPFVGVKKACASSRMILYYVLMEFGMPM
jgi:hypothetical protein